MKHVRNTTRLPLRVPLAGGKTLFLAPRGTGQVSDDAVERAAFKKLLEAGSVEVIGDGQGGSASGEAGPTPRESTQGRHKSTIVVPKGNR